MPGYVVKAAPDRDLYLIWSTIADAPEWERRRCWSAGTGTARRTDDYSHA